MNTRDRLSVAADALRGNPMRSFLTALGVVIGVSAVIVMVSIGEGARTQVTQQIRSLGSNLLMINPAMPDRTQRGALRLRSINAFNLDLLSPIMERCPSVARVAPEAGGQRNVSFGQSGLSTSIVGTNENYPAVRNLELALGSFFTADDVKGARKVAVLGSETAAELFANRNPLGQQVKIGRAKFTVIGTLAAKGGAMSQDDVVYVPVTTAQRRLFGNDRLRVIYAEAVDAEAMDQAMAEIDQVLAVELGSSEAYTIRNQAEILSTVEDMTRTLTLLLAGIAGVSLLVGGIGIMNIMLVSVTERIKEIGLRKAIGAREGEIMGQFLLEAAALSLAGGGIGILLGAIGSAVLSRIFAWQTVVSPTAVTAAFGLSLAVGLFFGVYPARKAARLDPIVALRHE